MDGYRTPGDRKPPQRPQSPNWGRPLFDNRAVRLGQSALKHLERTSGRSAAPSHQVGGGKPRAAPRATE